MAPHPLDRAITVFRNNVRDAWDSEAWMDEDTVRSRPPGRFIRAAYRVDPEAVRWLVYFSARRSLSCWELSCDATRPRQIVEELGLHLREGAEVDWDNAMQAERSPFKDCRQSDTQSAANAVAEAAKFLHLDDPRHAIYCLSASKIAYEHVLVEDRYAAWLIDIAIPVALQKREMTPEEQEALRAPPNSDTQP